MENPELINLAAANKLAQEMVRRLIALEETSRIQMTQAGGIDQSREVAGLTHRMNLQVGEIEALKVTVSTLREMAMFRQDEPVNTHPIGLCQDTSCEVCVSQGQELVQVAQEYARAAYADEIDEALRLAAGDAIRQRVAQLVQQGDVLRRQRAQVVEIVG